MPIPSRGIGWSTTDNLLWQISKQLEGISCQLCDLNNNFTTTTTSTAAPATTSTTTTEALSVYLVRSCDTLFSYDVTFTTPVNVGDVFTTATAPLDDRCYEILATTANPPQLTVTISNTYPDCVACEG